MALRFSQILLGTINNISRQKKFHTKAALLINGCLCRKNNFKNYSFVSATKLGEGASETPPKKKKPIIPRITLLNGSEITITTLEEAQKLSKRRDLKLVKIVDLDTKTQRPIYRLMTGVEYHAEELKQRERKKQEKSNALKGEKLLMITYKIANHDLETNIKKISKWVEKSFEVRVIISGDSGNMQKSVSRVYSKMFQ